MSLILDTHILLWWLGKLRKLPAAAHRAIQSADAVTVSAASAWEIAIKRGQGKLEAPDDLADVITGEGFEALPITFEHAREAGALPRHHRDPFDRMLIAQARLERLTVVTVDSRFAKYDVELLPL
ncbi:MAG TPA: type II toxin-antitoxin system VapC family toxin [Jatrophihabitantaceae bacterium]